jgi:hypothetical protein
MEVETRLPFSSFEQRLFRAVAFMALTLALGLNLTALFHLPVWDLSAPGELSSPTEDRPQPHRGPWGELSIEADA